MTRRSKPALAVGLAALLAGCAGAVTDYPTFEPGAVGAERVEVFKGVIESAIAREDRLRDLAWPMLRANAALCGDKTRHSLGIRLGDAGAVDNLISGLNQRQIEQAGYTDTPLVLSVAATSPADLAGVAPGDIILKVGEAGVGDQLDLAARTMVNLIEDMAPGGEETLALTVRRGGDILVFDIAPEEVCEIRIVYDASTQVNASASGSTLTVNAGLMNALEDDAHLAFVLGHELGHIAARHSPKLMRNMIVTGFAAWGPVVGVGGQVFDFALAGPLEALAGVETPPGRAAFGSIAAGTLGIRNFEREADYLGLYFHARAGYPLDGVEDVFDIFAQTSPASAFGRRTHPVTPERILAIGATRREIEAKLAAGAPLIPEGWPAPQAE